MIPVDRGTNGQQAVTLRTANDNPIESIECVPVPQTDKTSYSCSRFSFTRNNRSSHRSYSNLIFEFLALAAPLGSTFTSRLLAGRFLFTAAAWPGTAFRSTRK
jgi:hypothetical protein